MRKLFGFLSVLLFIVGLAEVEEASKTPLVFNGPLLLYSTNKDIRLTNSTRNAHVKIKTNVLVGNLTDRSAVDFHYEKGVICWADHGVQTIQCINFKHNRINGTVDVEDQIETILTGDQLLPVGLACDWFTNKLYWTDSEHNRIEVATLKGLHRKVLFWKGIDQPRAIALVPMKGLMFWTDWGEIPKIERASMNGDPSSRSVIVRQNIFWPNGLTVDYEQEKIYWIDGRLRFIAIMNYDGSNRTTLVDSKFEYPFALTMLDHRLFWTDWKTWSIHYYDQLTKDFKELIHLSDSIPMDIHVFDAKRQPKGAHPCQVNNGGCSHLCLLAPEPVKYTCECPIGIKHIDNYTCADRPQEMLLLARQTDICLIYLDSPGYSYEVIPLKNVKYTIAVDYDPVEEYIYWTDDEVKKIQRAFLNGTNQEDVIFSEIQHPDGIAIDWIARNVYWTDTGTDRLEMARLSSKWNYRRVVISEDLQEPRAVSVAPELGWLFWSDWNSKNPKIERSNLDGTERQVIINKRIHWPNGLTLDLDKERIYWCDARFDKIEYSNMNGSDRHELINKDVPHVFGFSLMGDFLYWTDWQRRSVNRAHKEYGNNREVIVDQIANVMGLKTIQINHRVGWNLCKDDNGNCSQICYFRHNKTKVCACEFDYELAEDGRTCLKPKTFLFYTTSDKIGRTSIENKNNHMVIPLSGIKHISGFDYDSMNSRMYWCDNKLKTIMSALINGSDLQRVIDVGLTSPESIAVDWISMNIYWTDSVTNKIEVARIYGTSRRTLLWKDVYKPRNLVVDPLTGYMFWCETKNSNYIKKANMDGSNSKILIDTVNSITNLIVDYNNKMLYWSELEAFSIYTCNYNGNNRRLILRNDDYKPITISLHNDYIYWSNNISGDIYRANKAYSDEHTKVDHVFSTVTKLMVYHMKPEGKNPCFGANNGGCSHLCLPLPSEDFKDPSKAFTCACPTHFALLDNHCVAPQHFMLYSQKTAVTRLLPDTNECPEAVLPIEGLKNIKAIDFDPVHNYLYWIEGKTATIKRTEITGTHPAGVMLQSVTGITPYDLAIDPIGRLLFWSCSSQNVINVTRLDNTLPFGVVIQRDGEKPRLLALHLNKRLLFYTDIGGAHQLIRSRFDGSHRIVITRNKEISALAVDSDNDLIVWSHGQSIYISNIDGENQHVLLNESNSRITHLTVHSGWLYWIDREQSQLQRIDLIAGKSRSLLSIQALNIVDMISVQRPNFNHTCAHIQQRRCSHFCILNGTSPMCACPRGHMLKEDKKTCTTLIDCGVDRFTCTVVSAEDKDCIPLSWRCDNQEDCMDGSDELDCPVECRSDQFKCADNQCIDLNGVCDGYAHCLDKSDEANCCRDGFQCPNTQVCLQMALVCDQTNHCVDGADENTALCNASKAVKHTSNSTVLFIIFGVFIMFVGGVLLCYCLLKKWTSSNGTADENTMMSQQPIDEDWMPMQPNSSHAHQRTSMRTKSNGVSSSGYDRNHITGASSSTNGSSLVCYPRETLNPPPSPVTTWGSSPSARFRPYRNYRVINQPPPPTQCSTDVCDESEYNYYIGRSKYDSEPSPPPPTPRSHCHSESIPTSPSSRSSTYFSPLPPPPSPVLN